MKELISIKAIFILLTLVFTVKMYDLYFPSHQMKTIKPPKLIGTKKIEKSKGYDFSNQTYLNALEKLKADGLSKLDLYELNSRNLNGDTLLHYSVRNQHIELTKKLIQRGMNPKQENNSGITPIDIAIQQGLDLQILKK